MGVDILILSFDFVPTRFDNDVWIRLHQHGNCYEYVCTHSDDFLRKSSKGPPDYYLGHDYKKDKQGRWCVGCKKYLVQATQRIEMIFGDFPKKNTPMVTGDHPEEDTTRLLDENEHNKYQMLIGI